MRNRKHYFVLALLCLGFVFSGTAQSYLNQPAALHSCVTHKVDSMKKSEKLIKKDAYRAARKYGYVKVLKTTDRIRKAQLAELTPIRIVKARTNSITSMRQAIKKQAKQRSLNYRQAMTKLKITDHKAWVAFKEQEKEYTMQEKTYVKNLPRVEALRLVPRAATNKKRQIEILNAMEEELVN